MKNNPVKIGRTISLLLVITAFQACQKDPLPASNTPENTPLLATNRDGYLYGVTPGTPNAPSILMTLSTAGSGGAIYGIHVEIAGHTPAQPVIIHNLTGICTVDGEVFVSTGPNVVNSYSNLLLKVDPFTGEGVVLSQSNIGAVSDIEYDPKTGTIYGLLNNQNVLVSISKENDNWGTYKKIGPITNLEAGYVARGLSMVQDATGDKLVVAATRTVGGNAQLYAVPFTAGSATFLANVSPASQLATGHCALGFDGQHGLMLINRRPSALGLGLNAIKWLAPLPTPSISSIWGTEGYGYVDLSSVF